MLNIIRFFWLLFTLFATANIYSQTYNPMPYFGVINNVIWSNPSPFPFITPLLYDEVMFNGPTGGISNFSYIDHPGGIQKYSINSTGNDQLYLIDFPVVASICQRGDCLFFQTPNCNDVSHNPKSLDWGSRAEITSSRKYVIIRETYMPFGYMQDAIFTFTQGINGAKRYFYKGQETSSF